MILRSLTQEEAEPAIELAWNVFLEFEAPDYSQEGVEEFRKTIQDPEFVRTLTFYGAFDGEEMVGVLATRSNGNHIALFFITGKMQGKGIGRKLFALAVNDNKSGKMTVNSSPYAVEIYRHFGFVNTDVEQVTNGIRFTPMELIIE